MPNNAICLFAGSSGMRPRTFWTLNVLGTIGRLVFFWYLGKALHDPLTRFLDWVQRYQWPLLALSVGIVMVQAFRSQSRGEIEPISAIEDEIEALTIEAAEPPADAAKPTEAGTIGRRREQSRRRREQRTSGRVGALHRGVAVVTGASSGIGAATARQLAKEGFDVVIGARRVDRLREVADATGARAMPLDVEDDASVDDFCAAIDECRVLVNNAGGALGLDAVEKSDLDDWQWMFDANVLGTVRMTKALLPKLEASGDGHIVLMGSVAGLEGYIGGAGYNAAKFAVHALHQVLRMELLGRPIRVTEIDPGACETEFSLVRFGGDSARAAKVYEGLTPLTADDVAECVAFAVTRPSHVNIDQIVLMPRDQANARMFHRRT